MVLRKTIGTMGTPACMAMWKAPFLKPPRWPLSERVPSGAIARERPCFKASTAGSSASMARFVSDRSMKTMPPSWKTGPKSGFQRSSCLATPVMSRRSSLIISSASRPLWWLKRKTAGRLDHRFSSPITCSWTPASEMARSPQIDASTFTPSRRDALTTPAASPAQSEGTTLP